MTKFLTAFFFFASIGFLNSQTAQARSAEHDDGPSSYHLEMMMKAARARPKAEGPIVVPTPPPAADSAKLPKADSKGELT